MSEGTPATLAATWSPAAAVVPTSLDLPDRYTARGLLEVGGMATVHRVHDRVLDREVAVKVLPAGTPVEARLTARLEHPGIVPVYDLGVLPDGRGWYAMRIVRGETLDAVAARVRAVDEAGWGTTDDGWSLRRLVAAVETAARALAYAHERGVVHRDIKPGNIMVGAFGEVQVLDWGIAAERGEPVPRPWVGTPAYACPEWTREPPPALEPTGEVWALGATLYALLAGRPPYLGTSAGVFRRLRAGARPEPLAGVVHPGTPDALVSLVDRTLAADPTARPGSAVDVADGLRAWLDGALRRARALAVLDEAREQVREARTQRAAAERARQRADAALDPVPPWAPEADKHQGWRAEDAADEAERAAERAETDAEVALQAAIALDDAAPEPRRELAALYRRQAERAERQGDGASLRRLIGLLAAHDVDGHHRDFLDEEVAVHLRTAPPGARVQARPLQQSRRRWVPGPARDLGRTPLRAVLPAGRWRLEIHAEGRPTVRLPVRLRRAVPWPEPPPEGVDPAIHLPEVLPGGTVYVPAGWVSVGGDPRAVDALTARRVWVDGFAMQIHPVTVGDWRVFLQDLWRRGAREQARARVPAQGRGVFRADRTPIGHLDEDGRLHIDPATANLARGGDDVPAWTDDWPVSLISWRDATAYAAWRAARDGWPWRLPHGVEWEKAARGPDLRGFPWGEQREASWTCMVDSHAGVPTRAGVRDLPDDVSPYGVSGMGGNVRDLCLNAYRRAGDVADGERLVVGPPADDESLRIARGGSWSSAWAFCRAASRFASAPDTRLTALGFRLVCPLRQGFTRGDRSS